MRAKNGRKSRFAGGGWRRLSLLLALSIGAPGCTDSGGSDTGAGGAAAGDNGVDHAGSLSKAGHTSAGTHTGGATTGGDATDGGAPEAGNGSLGGNAGANGGDTGIGGNEDAAGASGQPAAGKSYEATDCSGHNVELDPEWVKYCVVLSSCTNTDVNWCLMSPKTGYDVSVNGWRPNKPYDFKEPDRDRFELKSCERQLNSCDDLLACSGSGGWQQSDCEATTTAHCDGERAVNCHPNPGVDAGVQNCERLSGKKGACQVIGTGADARAVCVVKAACDNPGTQTCDGDKVVTCDATGIGGGEDCAQFGLKCRTSGTRASCAPPLPTETCTNKASLFCDGNAPAYCNPDGLLFKAPDCGASGDLVCSGGGADNIGDNWWDCVPRGCSITAWAGVYQECKGNDAVVDMGFWRVRIRCADYGLTCRGGGCVR